MKKALLVLLVLVVAFSFMAIAEGKTDYKIAWYASAVHPYFDAVKNGVAAFEKDTGIKVLQQIGQEWGQNNENENVEALVAKGYNAISMYPNDGSAANGLIDELVQNGVYVVTFGTSTVLPTKASFCVKTDVKDAAMVACEKLIALMGGKGRILNVLEVVADANTVLRKQGIEEVVAKHPGVKIIQEIGDMTSIEDATEKIQNALSAKINEVDGIICTGYTTTVAATQILTELQKSKKVSKKIRFVGIDDDKIVLQAIKDGYIDATIAQNPYGHGYIGCMLLKYLSDGYKPKPGVYGVNAGTAVVTKANVDTYFKDVMATTKKILAELTTKYLTK
jgi:ribose transport system substrate-binding protein